MQKKITLVLRILFGAQFILFGANKLFWFLPMPPAPERMQIIFGGLKEMSYFFPLLGITEVVCGVLLLAGLWVPLALTIIAPVVVNILMIHVFVDTAGLPIAIILTGIEIYLAYRYRSSFQGVLNKNAAASE